MHVVETVLAWLHLAPSKDKRDDINKVRDEARTEMRQRIEALNETADKAEGAADVAKDQARQSRTRRVPSFEKLITDLQKRDDAG